MVVLNVHVQFCYFFSLLHETLLPRTLNNAARCQTLLSFLFHSCAIVCDWRTNVLGKRIELLLIVSEIKSLLFLLFTRALRKS